MSPVFLFSAVVWCLAGVLVSYAQQCGRAPLVENRIVGGMDAPEGAWPWQVDITIQTDLLREGFGCDAEVTHSFSPFGLQTDSSRHICGGSIITRNWVLSAAHCFPNPSDVGSYVIYAGRYQLNGLNFHETSHFVRRVVVPNGYVEPHGGKDVALVELSTPVTWSDHVYPVCLPASGTLFPGGMLCYVTGWGNTRDEVPLAGAGTLQEVQVPIISQSSCQEMYRTHPTERVDILHDMICAGYEEGGKDSCQGDSGGPLVCQMVNGTWVQAGVVSFGLGCAHSNQPGVYARVTSYSSFISDTVPEVRLYGRADQNWCGRAAVFISCLFSLLIQLQR